MCVSVCDVYAHTVVYHKVIVNMCVCVCVCVCLSANYLIVYEICLTIM